MPHYTVPHALIESHSHRDGKHTKRTGPLLSPSPTSPDPPHTADTPFAAAGSPLLVHFKRTMCSLSTPSSTHSSLTFTLVLSVPSFLFFISLCGPRSEFSFSLSSLHVPSACHCSCLYPGWVGCLYASGLHLPRSLVHKHMDPPFSCLALLQLVCIDPLKLLPCMLPAAPCEAFNSESCA